jgi:hypothetical protein
MKPQANRYAFLPSLILALTFPLIHALGAAEEKKADPEQEKLQIVTGPYVLWVTQTGLTVMWETAEPASALVEYGTGDSLTNGVAGEPGQTLHEVRLTGLQPQTEYRYRVVSTDARNRTVTSDAVDFQTAVNEDTPFAFAAVSDSHMGWGELINRIVAERVNFLIHGGDATNSGEKQEWQNGVLKLAAPLACRVPLYIASGNHDGNSAWMKKYLALRNPENCYSFVYGNAHVIFMDNGPDVSPGSQIYNWLERDLSLPSARKAKWRFIIHHYPLYSSEAGYRASKGDIRARQLAPLYEKYGVDIVWSGHAHIYERTWPIRDGRVVSENGVVYVTIGVGGGGLDYIGPLRNAFTAQIGFGQGERLANMYPNYMRYCLVNINAGYLRMSVRDVTGQEVDWLELRK